MVSVTMNDLHKPALDQVLILISVEDGFCVAAELGLFLNGAGS